MLALQTLKTLGIQAWSLQQPEQLLEISERADQQIWQELERCVKHCVACPLHKTRTQTVFGTGNRHADLLIIGEAPGAQEDLQGQPFVGRAGSLLTEMLAAIDLNREHVFITNLLKCRPPNNRDPQPQEVAECIDYLLQQISLIKPKVILAVGRISAQNLLKRSEPLSKLRQQVHSYHNIPVIVTYHPAFLLRSPQQKPQAYRDLLKISQFISKTSE